MKGSFEMKKLREAIMGENEKNLEDLSNMDRKQPFITYIDMQSVYFRICAYIWSWVSECINSQILQQNLCLQVNYWLWVDVLYKFYSSWMGMLIRSAMAALDFNFNVIRKTKVSADGKQM